MNLLYLLLKFYLFNFVSPTSLDQKHIGNPNTADTLQQASVYIHFDKEMYNPGDVIWFKAYLFSDFFPATSESDITLKLVDANGKQVAKKSYPVVNATAIGEITLADTLQEGKYHLIAAASSIREKEEVYRKTFYVGYSKTEPSTSLADSVLLNFFPEGGSFFENKNTVTIIRSTDVYGMLAMIH